MIFFLSDRCEQLCITKVYTHMFSWTVIHYCFKGIGREKLLIRTVNTFKLLHKLVWKGFVKLPTPLIMCVQSGCTDRWSHWYVDEPWFWAYEVWSDMKDVLNKKPLLSYPQYKYPMALLNSHHQSSVLWKVYFIRPLNAESSSISSFIHECVTTGSGYLTDLVQTAQWRSSFPWLCVILLNSDFVVHLCMFSSFAIAEGMFSTSSSRKCIYWCFE